MAISLSLDYGRGPYPARFPDFAKVLRAKVPADAPRAVGELLTAALEQPIGARPLEEVAAGARSVLVVISDASRDEPRAELVRAVLSRLPREVAVRLAVATGTHGPADVAALGIPANLWRRMSGVINHDGHSGEDLVTLGVTPRGTPVRLHRAVVESDLVVATGCIIPHYFAGFSGGIKSVFPGLGETASVRANHLLKRELGARAGHVDDNPCRLDLEDVVPLLPRAPWALNLVVDDEGTPRLGVAGDVVGAHRVGAMRASELYRVTGRRAKTVVVSGRHPVTATLYQASKLVAAAAPLLAPGGTVVVVAECSEGTGPIEVVNRSIYELGIKPRLPASHRVMLVSSLPREVVERTYCDYAPSLDHALDDAMAAASAGESGDCRGGLLVLPHASSLLCEVDDAPPPKARCA